MKVKVTLEIEINTDEPKKAIEHRISSCDWDSLVSEEVEFALDEFGVVESVELDEVTAE